MIRSWCVEVTDNSTIDADPAPAGENVLPGPLLSARRNPSAERRGAVAQLGERLNGIQEVDGSIPFSSTFLAACECGRNGACGFWAACKPDVEVTTWRGGGFGF